MFLFWQCDGYSCRAGKYYEFHNKWNKVKASKLYTHFSIEFFGGIHYFPLFSTFVWIVVNFCSILYTLLRNFDSSVPHALISISVECQLYAKLVAMNTPHFDYENSIFVRDEEPPNSSKSVEGTARCSTYNGERHHTICFLLSFPLYSVSLFLP